jgi:hypothetical protein
LYAIINSKLLLLSVLSMAVLITSTACGGRPGSTEKVTHGRPEAPVVGGGTGVGPQSQPKAGMVGGDAGTVAKDESQGEEAETVAADETPSRAPHARAVAVPKSPPTTKVHTVSLSWGQSKSSVMGYFIYRGLSATGPFTRLNPLPDPATIYSDTAVVAGTVYYYAITAINTEGESVRSNVVKAVVPSP